jgi:hypothetical protein
MIGFIFVNLLLDLAMPGKALETNIVNCDKARIPVETRRWGKCCPTISL